ncbi:hypothetical protein D3C81_948510 [compost metagenome]
MPGPLLDHLLTFFQSRLRGLELLDCLLLNGLGMPTQGNHMTLLQLLQLSTIAQLHQLAYFTPKADERLHCILRGSQHGAESIVRNVQPATGTARSPRRAARLGAQQIQRIGRWGIQRQRHWLAIDGQVMPHVPQAFLDVIPDVEQLVVGGRAELPQCKDFKIGRSHYPRRQIGHIDLQRPGKRGQ